MSTTKRVNTKIVFDWATGAVEARVSHLYAGPFALCEGDDGGSSDDNGDDDGGGDKNAPPSDVVPKADYDALKQSFEALSGEIKKLKSVRDKDKDADRVKKGEHEKVIAEKTAALEEMEKKLEDMGKVVETYQSRDAKKANDLLSSLPEDVQTKIKPFKDQMSAAAWLDFLELQAGMYSSADDGDDDGENDDVRNRMTPPPTGSGTGKGGKKGGRELSHEAQEILGSLMRPTKGTMTEKLVNRRSESKDARGASAFTRPVEAFFGDMNAAKSEKMTLANANKRLSD